MYIYNFNKFYKIFVSYYHDTIQYTNKKKWIHVLTTLTITK